MKVFRRFYYKVMTLFCMFTTFSFVFNMEKTGVGNACFYIFVGVLCFGALSVGKEEFDPEKPVRNVLLLLGWSFLGFGITAIGILCLVEKPGNTSVITAFLVLAALTLLASYIISIIKNVEIFAILSIVLLIGGCFLGTISSGKPVLMVLTLVICFAAIALFVISLFKGPEEDD